MPTNTGQIPAGSPRPASLVPNALANRRGPARCPRAAHLPPARDLHPHKAPAQDPARRDPPASVQAHLRRHLAATAGRTRPRRGWRPMWSPPTRRPHARCLGTRPPAAPASAQTDPKTAGTTIQHWPRHGTAPPAPRPARGGSRSGCRQTGWQLCARPNLGRAGPKSAPRPAHHPGRATRRKASLPGTVLRCADYPSSSRHQPRARLPAGVRAAGCPRPPAPDRQRPAADQRTAATARHP